MPASPRQAQFIKSLTESRSQAIEADGKSSDAILALLDRIDTKQASSLIDVLMAMPENPRPASPLDPKRFDQVATLRQALPTLAGGDASFARSLVEQWDRKGHLSDKQWACVERLTAAPQATVEPGVYVLDGGGTFILVYATRNGHLAGKVWDGHSWQYESGAQRRAATGRPITAEQAAAFGHLTGQCVFCARELTDQRSIDVGYGPVCAGKNGLPWGELVS
jgi:hypothetical protein